jgi:formylglycine-generating enzyme required for sulfatase activity
MIKLWVYGILAVLVSFGALGQDKPVQPQDKPALGKASDQGLFNKKVTIADLMKLEAFTNSTDMVMRKISDKMWASQTLVSQQDYQKVMGSNPSQFGGANRPVDSVSWNDALAFCARLTDAEKKAERLPEGFVYTIPTQAQWESLVGNATAQTCISSLDQAFRNGTAPVTASPLNSFGLHDARGNLWQWCLDPQDKPYRVLRGGAWNEFREPNMRIDFRWYGTGPDDRQNIYGFRVLLVPG